MWWCVASGWIDQQQDAVNGTKAKASWCGAAAESDVVERETGDVGLGPPNVFRGEWCGCVIVGGDFEVLWVSGTRV